MLVRQRVLLRLVERANGPLSSTIFFKLAFLLRQETSFAEEPTFYDFLPYKFGPYSFAMHRELDALVSYGYLTAQITSSGTRFARGAMSDDRALPTFVDDAIDETLNKYQAIPQRTLLQDVYSRYPWYATNTELRDLLTTPVPVRVDAKMAVYTIGYHRSSVDFFADRLLRAGMRVVVDVRANPISRKYGFAGSSLQSICRKVGLSYQHFPGLGIPSSKRKGVSGTAAFNELFSNYERHTLAENTKDVDSVAELINSLPSVLLCAEQNASECHRSRLAVAVADSTGLPIIDL